MPPFHEGDSNMNPEIEENIFQGNIPGFDGAR